MTERLAQLDAVEEYRSLMDAVRIVQKARQEIRQDECFAFVTALSPAGSFLYHVESFLMKRAELAMRGAPAE